MALVVAAIVALTTQTGQAAAAGSYKAATAGAVQDCPAGQDCGGYASQAAGSTTQSAGGAAQDRGGCSVGGAAQGSGQAAGSDGSGDCCPN